MRNYITANLRIIHGITPLHHHTPNLPYSSYHPFVPFTSKRISSSITKAYKASCIANTPNYPNHQARQPIVQLGSDCSTRQLHWSLRHTKGICRTRTESDSVLQSSDKRGRQSPDLEIGAREENRARLKRTSCGHSMSRHYFRQLSWTGLDGELIVSRISSTTHAFTSSS